ncbi:MAG: DUF4105 domain-containing protein [Gemmatimonadaceae bacterium]
MTLRHSLARLRPHMWLLIAGVLAVTLVIWYSIRPSSDRQWIPEQAEMASATFTADTVAIRNIRNFTYTARGEFQPAYADRTYDLNALTSVWYVLTPFSRNWRGPAHSFVSFGFSDGEYVAISVEARRQPGEVYDAVKGLFKRFELIYVVGDERDLIGQRAAFGSDPVHLYPVRTTPEKMRALFVGMLERANQLREQPEFYNTLTNNCTSNVVAHVNRITPRKVPSGLKTILPGYTDEVALRLGLIDTELDIARAREQYRINDRARRFIGDPAFSARIRGL